MKKRILILLLFLIFLMSTTVCAGENDMPILAVDINLKPVTPTAGSVYVAPCVLEYRDRNLTEEEFQRIVTGVPPSNKWVSPPFNKQQYLVVWTGYKTNTSIKSNGMYPSYPSAQTLITDNETLAKRLVLEYKNNDVKLFTGSIKEQPFTIRNEVELK